METKQIYEEYLTPKEIEKKLKLSHATVSKLIHLPGFPMIKIGGSVRIYKNEFEKFMQDYKTKSIKL